MAQRTFTLTAVITDATGAPIPNAPCSVQILTPTGAPAIDGTGAIVGTAPVPFAADASGAVSQAVDYPGDYQPAYQNSQVRVILNGQVIDSPVAFAYASSIAASSWIVAPSTSGLVTMRLVYTKDDNSGAGNVALRVALSQAAVVVATGQIAAGSAQPIKALTASDGTAAFSLNPTSLLNPSTLVYELEIGGEQEPFFFTVPTVVDLYRGAYSGTFAYPGPGGSSNGDVVTSGGVLYRSIAPTTGHAPPNGTYWQVVSGLPTDLITNYLQPGATSGVVAVTVAGIAHDSNVPALVDDPVQSPATLDDDLHNLAGRFPGNRRTITTSAAISAVTDDTVLCNAAGGAIAPTLPLAANRTRKLYFIKTDAAANVTITATGGNLINGAATLVLSAQYQWAVLESDGGTNWYAQTGTGGGGTLPITTEGDLIVGNSGGVAARLPLGTPGQVVSPVGSDAAWLTPSGIPGGAGGADPSRNEGDITYRRVHSVTSMTIGYIGDSITSTNPPGGVNPAANADTFLSTDGLGIGGQDQGVSGTASSDWLPGSTNLTSAKAVFSANGVRVVHIMLGTNDARAAIRNSAAAFQSNLQSICNDLVGSGYLVALSYPPYCVPGSNGGDQDATANTLRVAYQAKINQMVNGRDVFLADTSAYLYFQANAGQLSDGIHPTATGSQNLGQLWANGLAPLVAALAHQVTQQALPIGANGQFLGVAGGTLAYLNVPGGFTNPMTAPDDLVLGGAGGAATRLPKGAPGQVLTTNAGTGHVDWDNSAAGFSNPMTTPGDLITGGGAGVAARLGIGASGQYLRAVAGAVAYDPGTHYEPLVLDNPGGTAPIFVVNDNGQPMMIEVSN